MPKILVITGKNESVEKWRDLLVSKGYDFYAALSIMEGIDKAALRRPDVIVIESIETPIEAIKQRFKMEGLPENIPLIKTDYPQELTTASFWQKIERAVYPPRILIAEDDRQFSELLANILSANGYNVKTVHDGSNAIRMVKSFKPHLMVLDIMMPVLDGFHVCQVINDDTDINSRPKIIIISARGTDWDKKLGDACGVEDYLVKPFSNTLFLEKVREITSRKQPQNV
jgi:CheY-like chemotaxis protein